jgi:hypothetical protein
MRRARTNTPDEETGYFYVLHFIGKFETEQFSAKYYVNLSKY